VQLADDMFRACRVGHHHALGHFQFKALRLHAPCRHDVGEFARQAGEQQLVDGEIHGHIRRQAFVFPCPYLPACGLEHQAPQRFHQPGFFGERDKGVGRKHRAVLLGPADQRLHTDGLRRIEFDDRLVVQGEAVLVDGAAQAGFQ
jgi:hypothetical protein